MSWEVIVEYATGERLIFNGEEEPQVILGEALSVCEAALELGLATRLVMTYQEGM